MLHFKMHARKVVWHIQLSERQKKIVNIVKDKEPITGELIAQQLSLTKATLRPDLAILTMSGILDARPRVGYFYSGKTNLARFSEELRKLKVGDFKSVPTVVKDTTSLYDAVVKILIEDGDALIIVNGEGYLEGILSKKDLLKVALGKMDLYNVPVSVMMTRVPNVVTATQDESIYTVANKLITHEINAVPVVKHVEVDDKNKMQVTGSLGKTNITKILVELAER